MILAEVKVSGVCAYATRKRLIPAGIVGAQVSFSFTDPKWDNLTKTVVFKGFGTKDVLLKGDTVRIPQEVVSRKDVRLLVGVYGTDAEKTIAIPTLWADLGTVRNAADPSGDEAADPALPIWATLQAEIDQLKENGASDEQIAAAVEAYLQKNTVGTGTVKMVNDIEPDENGNVVIDIPKDYVKTVNGATPDENGNIEIEIPDSGGNVNQVSGDVFEGYDRFYDSIARMQVNPTEPLDIVTYDGSNKPTHPAILYFENGWAGHKFWLAYSPFPGNNNTYENPCIAYSEDGVNFTSDGISNPIEDTPMENGTKVGYNSDPHLVVVNGVMECWWRTHHQSGSNANHEIIYRKKSTDGINWGVKEELFRVNDAAAGSCMSPAVIYEDGIYKIWTVYKQQVMRYYESTTGADWSHIRDINVDNPNYPTYKVWHIDVIHTEKGYEFVGCYHPTNDYNDNKYIYYAVSSDNITYSERVLILTPGKTGNFDATELYRPAIARVGNKVMIYYGCRNGAGNWKIGMIEAPTPYLFNAVLKNGLRYDALESRVSALESGSGGSGDPTASHSITYRLTNCTSSNGATSVSNGASYTARLTTTTGYTLGEPTITMGGVDITASAWDGSLNTITIGSVTGAVIITCSAVANGDTGGNPSNDSNTVVSSFEESEWISGYYNDSGALENTLDMHHSQMMPVSDCAVSFSAQYPRVVYFDSDKNYLTYDRGAGLGVGTTSTYKEIYVNPSAGTYFAVCANTATKDDITITTLEQQFVTTAEPIACYLGSQHGDVDGEWAEVNGGTSIAVTGGTWTDGILEMDGVDDRLTLPLGGAKTVVMKAKLLEELKNGSSATMGYVFDCRPTASAYLLNYNQQDYVGGDATVYARKSAFEGVMGGFAAHHVPGRWIYFTIVFNSAFTGNMNIFSHNNRTSDFMQAEIEEIKVYDVDITAV